MKKLTTISLKIEKEIVKNLDKVANDKGLTRSSYLKALVIEDLKRYTTPKKEEPKDLKALLYEGIPRVDSSRRREPTAEELAKISKEKGMTYAQAWEYLTR